MARPHRANVWSAVAPVVLRSPSRARGAGQMAEYVGQVDPGTGLGGARNDNGQEARAMERLVPSRAGFDVSGRVAPDPRTRGLEGSNGRAQPGMPGTAEGSL